MSKGYPQVGDLVMNHKNELCFITGFGEKRRNINKDYCVRVILNFGDGGKSIGWNTPRRGVESFNHLTLNNKGVWELSVKKGQCPLFIEWLKDNG